MNKLTAIAVRGTRCLLVVVHSEDRHSEFEYEQDAYMFKSVNDALYKFEGGDEDVKGIE
jgi:hypothetical protein